MTSSSVSPQSQKNLRRLMVSEYVVSISRTATSWLLTSMGVLKRVPVGSSRWLMSSTHDSRNSRSD